MRAAIIGAKYDKDTLAQYTEIKSVLESLGVKVDFSYFTTSVEEDTSSPKDTYKKIKDIITNSDFIVAETSHYSSGIGFLIGAAYHDRKPVLTLFNKELGTKPSSILKSSSSKALKFTEYTKANLKDILSSFTEEVKGMLDTKFILIISPEIDKYLEWASTERRMHKAQIVRNALQDIMEKDKEYKAYLKDIQL